MGCDTDAEYRSEIQIMRIKTIKRVRVFEMWTYMEKTGENQLDRTL